MEKKVLLLGLLFVALLSSCSNEECSVELPESAKLYILDRANPNKFVLIGRSVLVTDGYGECDCGSEIERPREAYKGMEWRMEKPYYKIDCTD